MEASEGQCGHCEAASGTEARRPSRPTTDSGSGQSDSRDAMARTRNAAKRQKLQKVEAALFNPGRRISPGPPFWDARDLCRASLTCKALGAKRDHGPSLVEEAARRQF
ncbi:hypothetical protein THAOC_34591, partial [Thalassiosira oceanica]